MKKPEKHRNNKKGVLESGISLPGQLAANELKNNFNYAADGSNNKVFDNVTETYNYFDEETQETKETYPFTASTRAYLYIARSQNLEDPLFHGIIGNIRIWKRVIPWQCVEDVHAGKINLIFFSSDKDPRR